MKISTYLFLATLIFSNCNFAAKTIPDDVNFKHLGPDFLYGYSNFKFNGSKGLATKIYKGHTNTYGLGSKALIGKSKIIAGIAVYHQNSNVNSSFSYTPSLFTSTKQDITNNSIYVNLLAPIASYAYVNLGAGFGQSKISSLYFVTPLGGSAQIGSSKSNADNWIFKISGIAYKKWSKFLLSENLGFLYNQVNVGAIPVLYAPSNISSLVRSQKSRITWIISDTRLKYSYTKNIMPFIDLGLFFPLKNTLVKAQINNPAVGSLAALNIAKNAYRLGAGVNILKDKFALTLAYKYYSAGSIYKSNQAFVKLHYKMA